jgi:hypothetical protein
MMICELGVEVWVERECCSRVYLYLSNITCMT